MNKGLSSEWKNNCKNYVLASIVDLTKLRLKQ